MGAVLAMGFLFSAGFDLAVGQGLRHLLDSAVSAGRLQFGGSVLSAVALTAVFLGAWMPAEGRFTYALAAGIGFRLGFAIYDIPQNALMALATTDAGSRLRIAATRIWFSGTATLIVAAAVGPLVAMKDTFDGTRFLLALTGAFALIAVASAGLLARLLANAPAPAQAEAKGNPASWRPPAAFWLLIGVMIATSIFTPVFAKLEPYFAAYVLRSPWWGGIVIVTMAAGIIAGQPLWVRLSRRFGHGEVMALAALLQMVGLAAFWAIGGSAPILSSIAAFLFGLGNGGVGMVLWGAFSNVVARMGPERAGISYGLFVATAKLSFAAGGLLLAWALTHADYRAPGSHALVALMACIPTIGAVCCAIIGLRLDVASSDPAVATRSSR